MKLTRPAENEYAPGLAVYISLVPEADILHVLDEQQSQFDELSKVVSSDASLYRYQPGKWSIREMIRHMADAERVFAYRALTFARGDEGNLPGFDEDRWAAVAPADEVPFSALVQELVQVRCSNILMLRYLDDEGWDRRGTANGKLASVRALAYAIAGHARHHMRVLQERYLTRK